jgi:multiple sugar transport system substrate-binding protein
MKPSSTVQGVKTLDYLVDQVRSGFVSPGHYNRLWVEEPIELGTGRVAMAATYSELFAALMAPEYKDMVGKIGYAELPKMERKYTLISSMNYGISKGSKNPKEAYRYLAWLLSDRNDARLVTEVETAKMPSREKTFTDPKVAQVIPFAPSGQDPRLPSPGRVSGFEEMMVGIGIAVQEAIDGKKTSKQALTTRPRRCARNWSQAIKVGDPEKRNRRRRPLVS